MTRIGMLALGAAIALSACQGSGTTTGTSPSPAPSMAASAAPSASASVAATSMLQLTSSAFTDGGQIPLKYTCDAGSTNPSPPLAWTGAPDGTLAYALLVEDPDAVSNPPFVHWVLFNVGATSMGLEENATANLPPGALNGNNGRSAPGWTGPCPPSGNHRYIFTLYALNQALSLPAGATKAEMRAAMEGHILGQATLTGKYQRSGS